MVVVSAGNEYGAGALVDNWNLLLMNSWTGQTSCFSCMCNYDLPCDVRRQMLITHLKIVINHLGGGGLCSCLTVMEECAELMAEVGSLIGSVAVVRETRTPPLAAAARVRSDEVLTRHSNSISDLIHSDLPLNRPNPIDESADRIAKRVAELYKQTETSKEEWSRFESCVEDLNATQAALRSPPPGTGASIVDRANILPYRRPPSPAEEAVRPVPLPFRAPVLLPPPAPTGRVFSMPPSLNPVIQFSGPAPCSFEPGCTQPERGPVQREFPREEPERQSAPAQREPEHYFEPARSFDPGCVREPERAPTQREVPRVVPVDDDARSHCSHSSTRSMLLQCMVELKEGIDRIAVRLNQVETNQPHVRQPSMAPKEFVESMPSVPEEIRSQALTEPRSFQPMSAYPDERSFQLHLWSQHTGFRHGCVLQVP